MIEGKVRFACRNICALALGDVAEAIYLYILSTGNVSIGPRPTFAVRLPNRTRGRLGKLAFMGAQTSKFGHSVWGLIGVYGVPIVSSVPMSPCRRLWQHGECSYSLPSTQFFFLRRGRLVVGTEAVVIVLGALSGRDWAAVQAVYMVTW
jgi:hypothetical protein